MFPVIVHTSNYHAAPRMVLALETHGWDVARVTPFGDLEWLTQVWVGVVEEKLGHATGAAPNGAAPVEP